MCTVIVCYPVCDVINFEIYLSFLFKPFFYLTKNSEQKLKYLKNDKIVQEPAIEVFTLFLTKGLTT